MVCRCSGSGHRGVVGVVKHYYFDNLSMSIPFCPKPALSAVLHYCSLTLASCLFIILDSLGPMGYLGEYRVIGVTGNWVIG